MTVIDTYRLDLPPGWLELSTDADEIRRSYRQVRDPGAWDALPKTERRRAEIYLERFIADLQRGNVTLAAMYRELVGADGADATDSTDATEASSANGTSAEADEPADGGDDQLLLASCVVSVTAASDSPLPDIDADTLLGALSLDRPVTPEERAQLGTALEPPRTVDLAAGSAVRTSRLLEPDFPGVDTPIFAATYYVPVPGDGGMVLVAQFATPNAGDAAVFAELFDAIVNTLRFYADDEPTEL
ncbi:MAG: hypothetical protein ACK5OX_18185 [Desertimonas sp.]